MVLLIHHMKMIEMKNHDQDGKTARQGQTVWLQNEYKAETSEEEEEDAAVTGGRTRDGTELQLWEDVNRWRNLVH